MKPLTIPCGQLSSCTPSTVVRNPVSGNLPPRYVSVASASMGGMETTDSQYAQPMIQPENAPWLRNVYRTIAPERGSIAPSSR